MDSFLLLPCIKPSQLSRQVLLQNGEVYCQGEGKIWRDSDQHARKLVNIRDENQDVKIRDIQYCPSLDALLFLIEGYSGVFANPASSSLCMPLGFGRLTCGLRVAQPVRTSGPRATCMDISNNMICAGDAWGAIAIWRLDGNISDPPPWAFGAHDGIGCSSVVLLDDYDLVVTSGGIREQVKVWSLEEQGEVHLLGCYTLKDRESFSSNPLVLFANKDDGQQQSVIVLVGVNNGHLLLWEVSLSSEEHARNQREDNSVKYVKMTSSANHAISKLNVFEDKLIFASFDDGKLMLLDARSIINQTNIRLIGKRQFAKVPLGIFEDMIVFDSFTSVPFATILDDISNNMKNGSFENDSDEDDLDSEKRHGHVRTNAKSQSASSGHRSNTQAMLAPKRALNRPLHDTTTFGQDLTPIDPDKPRKGRRCCKVPPPSSVPEQIRVKRKVKPPPLNPLKRRPLYENPLLKSSTNNTGKQQQRPVRLPPFCKSTTNRPSWTLPEFYLKEMNGNIVTSTIVEKYV